MTKLASVILAGGLSTRMKSKLPKVLHLLAGRRVLAYPIATARSCGAKDIIVVRGPKQSELASYIDEQGVSDAVQQKPLGTANAVQSAEKALGNFSGYVLILCGDVPLVRAKNLMPFIKAVRDKKSKLGVLTMCLEDPGAYGRIIRDLDGKIVRIVEAKDAAEDELKVQEVNSSIYCVDKDWLFKVLKKLKNDNAKGEYYLTDIVGQALKEGMGVVAYRADDPNDFLGINTRVDLARAAEIMRERINCEHMLNGVGILDYRHTYVDADVRVGGDTTIMPFSFLLGRTKVGSNCIIENGVVLKDAVIGDGVHVKSHSVIDESRVADDAVVGPFARIRPDSKVGREARVGNFVELKKCDLKDGAKANHLTYLGDASIGARSNIGCGTITCNYDGVAKYKTVIGEGVFVGSDTQFVAPVRVGRKATIGAGSTITKDVPADSLALSRADQKIVRGWKPKRRNLDKAIKKK